MKKLGSTPARAPIPFETAEWVRLIDAVSVRRTPISRSSNVKYTVTPPSWLHAHGWRNEWHSGATLRYFAGLYTRSASAHVQVMVSFSSTTSEAANPPTGGVKRLSLRGTSSATRSCPRMQYSYDGTARRR